MNALPLPLPRPGQASRPDPLSLRSWGIASFCRIRLGLAFALAAVVLASASAGTPQLVKDINTSVSSSSSSPASAVVVGTTAYFAASDGTHGTELWKSDGTAAGTVLVGDITGDSGSSAPGALTLVGTKIFFSATRLDVDRELFVFDLPTPTPTITTPTSVGTFTTSAAADTTPPTIVSVVRKTPATQNLANTTTTGTFTFTYSEAVTGVAAARFAIESVNAGTVAGTIGTPVVVSTSVYDVPVTLTSGSGEFRLKVID